MLGRIVSEVNGSGE